MSDLESTSRTTQWKINSRTQIDGATAVDCFNQEGIATLRKSRKSMKTKKINFEIQDFIYHVLEESDEVHISEDQVFFEARGRERHNSRKIYFGSDMTMQDKEDLYTIALLGDIDEEGSIRKERAKSYNEHKRGSPKKGGIKHFSEIRATSRIEMLSQILELPQEDKIQCRSKLNSKNAVVSVKVHEANVNGKSNASQLYYCKVGLVSIRDMKTKSRLDDVSSDVRTTNTTQSIGELRWNESFALMLGNETGLCVEVWNECTVLEKSKKKTKETRVKTFAGQCRVGLGKMTEKKILFSQDGKSQSGYVTLSIDVKECVATGLTEYSDDRKYLLYKTLLNEAVTYQISRGIPISYGNMETSVETVCTKIADILKLNEFERTAAEWSYFQSVENIIESSGKLEVNLIILNSKWDNQAEKTAGQEQRNLLHEINTFYKENLEKIKYILLKIPPRNENAAIQINRRFGILQILFLFLKDRDVISPTEDLKSHIINKIKEGVYSWYARTEERIINKESMQTYVNTLHTFCQHIIKFIQMLRKYYPGQSSVAKIDISQIAIVAIDPLLAGEVEMCVQNVSQAKASDELIFSMFSIERKIKLLIKEKNSMKDTDIELHIDFHVEWFRQFINKWLNILKKVSVEYVDKVIKYETSLKDIGVGQENLSSSAYDIAICLYPNYCFHAKMQEYLDTANRIHFSFQVVLLIQETLMRYIQIMGGKISQIVDGSEKNGFKLTTEICQIFNNIHFVKEYLEEVPRKLNTNSGDVTESDTRYQNLIKEAEECLGNEKSRVLSVILPHFHTQIKQYLRNLTSKENLPVEDAISDLMEWLVANIQICTTQLTQAMFNELLEVLWDLLLDNIYIIISDKQTSCNCHQQIFRAINILYDFFYNDGDGLSLEKIKKELFKNILQKVQLEMINSYDLMLECVREFANTNEMKFRSYGKLTFSMVYYEDRCILETNIMKVENIYNPSSMGKFKPIIEMSVIPKHLNIEVTQTKPYKFSENIFINEVLHVPIPQNLFSSIIIKISLFYRDALGIRSECYFGSIHVDTNRIGRGANNLREVINATDNNIGSLVERNFIYPFQEDSEKVKILRKRTDSVAQGFLKEMVQEQKKEQTFIRSQNCLNKGKKNSPILSRSK